MRIFGSTKGKVFIGLATMLTMAVAAAGTALAGWGPQRPTFTWNSPASYITFNSITNNPQYGDERPFYDVRDLNSAAVTDKITVQDNQELILRVYFHNNAAENLNLVARNTRVEMALPSETATNLFSTAYISSNNANPSIVGDTVDFTGERPFKIEYVPGSAQIWTGVLRGNQLSDDIIKEGGALVGYNAIDGNVPGCAQFSGYVTAKVRVKMQPAPVTPVFSCDALNVTTSAGRKVDANVAYTATGGATFKSTTFDWGDGKKDTVNAASASHTYGADGTYTIATTLTFNVGGTDKTAVCSKQVTFTTVQPPVVQPPVVTPGKGVEVVTQLPNTGPGAIAGLFAGVSALAGGAHYLWTRRYGA